MAQRKKTRAETVRQIDVNKADISRIFGGSHKKVSRLFEMASEIDDEELGRYRIDTSKVRLTTVCKIKGVTLNQLLRQSESN